MNFKNISLKNHREIYTITEYVLNRGASIIEYTNNCILCLTIVFPILLTALTYTAVPTIGKIFAFVFVKKLIIKMADSDIHQDNLTTDAVPNPRQTSDDNNFCEEESTFSNTFENEDSPCEEIHKNNPSSFSSGKKRNQRKFSPSSASATIINISNSKDIHVGNKNTYNFSGNEKEKKTDIPETAAIRLMKASKQIVTKSDLQFAAIHMNSQWKDVARACDIGEGQISQFIIDHQACGIKEVIYQVLLDWYQNEPTEATVGRLCTILWDNNQKDVVARWTHRRD